MGYEASFRCVGDSLKTYLCEVSLNGEVFDSGIGKGQGTQSKTSAIFEALEHIHLGLEAGGSDLPQRCLDLAGKDKPIANGSPCLLQYKAIQETPLTMVRFEEIDGCCGIDYPLFLVNPEFDLPDTEKCALLKTGLLKYSSNSGMASGVAPADARLHAILEIIERDSIGIELIRCVFSKDPSRFRSVPGSSLPGYLQELVDSIKDEINSTVALFDITTDTRVPSFLARVCAFGKNEGVYFGSGASLDPVYAAERALLEAVQSVHFHELYDQRRPNPGNIDVAKLPTYLKCWMESGILACDGNSTSIDFPYSMRTDSVLSVSDQMGRIIDNLNDIGIRVYERSISDAAVSVVQVLAPMLERFFLVGDGVFIAPGSRGRQFL